jgi:hypothetical protein
MLAFVLLAACAPCGDKCLHDDAIAAATPDEVVQITAQIADPIVRDAAVLQWIELHRGAVSPADSQHLCGILSPAEAQTCQRRAVSAHLQRR